MSDPLAQAIEGQFKDDRELADALLVMHSGAVDGLEQQRIAQQNRVRTLTNRWERDGVWYGLGLDKDDLRVQPLAQLRDDIWELEKVSIKQLERAMRSHYFGPWVNRTVGVGLKQGARLVATIRDPSTRENPGKLWHYCGMHVLDVELEVVQNGTQDLIFDVRPFLTDHEEPKLDDEFLDAAKDVLHLEGCIWCGKRSADTKDHVIPKSRGGLDDVTNMVPSCNACNNEKGNMLPREWADKVATKIGAQIIEQAAQVPTEIIAVGVAPTRRRGQKSDWNEDARKRLRMIADSCMKQIGPPKTKSRSPYRDLYEYGRMKYDGQRHKIDCPRCGPKGKPAKRGSPLSDGHAHARAIRLVMKRILLDLWREAFLTKGQRPPEYRIHGRDHRSVSINRSPEEAAGDL